MHRPRRRKLLVASVGIASVSYVIAVGCGGSTTGGETSGNLPAPPPGDGASNDQVVPPMSGNLVAPPPTDAAYDAPAEGGDAGDAGDAATDADAGT